MENKINEIKRFNDLIIKARNIVDGLKETGTDVDKIISLANNNGYEFTMDEVEKIKEEFYNSKIEDDPNGVVAGATVLAVVVAGVVVVI